MLDAAQISCTLAMFTNLSSSEAIDLLSSCIELLEWYPHLCSEITSFPEWIFLELFEALLSVKIVCDSLGHINECLICSFDFNILFLNLLVACVAVRMILDG